MVILAGAVARSRVILAAVTQAIALPDSDVVAVGEPGLVPVGVTVAILAVRRVGVGAAAAGGRESVGRGVPGRHAGAVACCEVAVRCVVYLRLVGRGGGGRC